MRKVIISYGTWYSPSGRGYKRAFKMTRELFQKYINYIQSKINDNDTNYVHKVELKSNMCETNNIAFLNPTQSSYLLLFLNLNNIPYSESRALSSVNYCVQIIESEDK